VTGQNLRARWRHARDWASAWRITEEHAKTTWRSSLRQGALITPLTSLTAPPQALSGQAPAVDKVDWGSSASQRHPPVALPRVRTSQPLAPPETPGTTICARRKQPISITSSTGWRRLPAKRTPQSGSSSSP